MIADEILKTVEFDALRIVYNKYNSIVSYVPTVATLLSPEVGLKSLNPQTLGFRINPQLS